MKYFFRFIRWPLGRLIILIDWLTRPRPKREALSPEEQEDIGRAVEFLKLYQFQMCPYCVRTRRTIHRLGLNIETRDARNDPRWQRELIEQGGKYQVPCLRVANEDGSVNWLYESGDINRYLEQRFG